MFSMLLSLISQTWPEEYFLNHENDLEDCDTLRALSTAWLVMPYDSRNLNVLAVLTKTSCLS